MLSIALCDDQPAELAQVVAYTKEYLEANGLDAKLWQSFHPDKLLTACEIERFSLYILDIVMPMVNGIEVGMTIRRLDREAQIIYVTSEPGFALQSFVANPINYLVKPIEKQQFFDTLGLAIAKVDMKEERTVTIKTRNGVRVLRLSSIVCCEYVAHTARYTLTSGEQVTSISSRNPFSAFTEPLLLDRRFLQPHNSFVFNMSRVEIFSRENFIMHGGTVVPIAKSHYTDVCNRYMDYVMARETVI